MYVKNVVFNKFDVFWKCLVKRFYLFVLYVVYNMVYFENVRDFSYLYILYALCNLFWDFDCLVRFYFVVLNMLCNLVYFENVLVRDFIFG